MCVCVCRLLLLSVVRPTNDDGSAVWDCKNLSSAIIMGGPKILLAIYQRQRRYGFGFIE